jgi:hypothetical protein
MRVRLTQFTRPLNSLALPVNALAHSVSAIARAMMDHAGDYQSGEATLEPLLDSGAIESPDVRAAITNNFALAVLLGHVGTPNALRLPGVPA